MSRKKNRANAISIDVSVTQGILITILVTPLIADAVRLGSEVIRYVSRASVIRREGRQRENT